MSTQVTINDVQPKTQITATGGQTVFSTNWTANAASDVVVYARTSTEEPDDLTQEVDSSNYSVSFVGTEETVEVTFSTGRTADDVITITRDTPADRLNLYTNVNFTASMLNQDIGILTLVDQQAQLYNDQIAPHYNVSATVDLGDTNTGDGGDIYLPILEANQFWVKNSSNTKIEAVTLPSGDSLPVTLPLFTYTSSDYLSQEQNLGALSTGVLYQTVASGSSTVSVLNTTGSDDAVLSTSPTITSPRIVSQINDTNGNPIIGLGVTSSAVNYLTITNQATGTPPFLSASGTDTNISINLAPKGTGLINIITEAATNPLTIVSGTSNQHVTTFNFSNTSASQSVTFPDESGTVQFVKSSPTMQIFASGSGTYTTPTGVKYIKIEMVGGGGGGGGGSVTNLTPTSGTNTTFGTSLLTANTNSGRTGGGYTINSPAYGFGVTGGTGGQHTAWSGATFTIQGAGGLGGSSYFGGSNSAYGAGGEGVAVSSSGTAASGMGAGAGGYICAYIDNPSSSYSYTVGTGGSGGGGTNGASGVIIVTEYYQ